MPTPVTMSETQRFEKENGQTACNMDLFDEDDDMEDTESQTQSGKRGTSQMDLDQPPTRTAPLDKREKRGTDPVCLGNMDEGQYRTKFDLGTT